MTEESPEDIKDGEDKETNKQSKETKNQNVEKKTEDEETVENALSDIDIDSMKGTSHILYGEEYEGEGGYYLPTQSLEVKESTDELEKTEELGEAEELEDLQYTESEAITEVSEGGGEETEEDEEARGSSAPTPAMSDDLKKISSESVFETMFLEPKEKTVSEIMFEAEHKELIEEEMKKLIQRKALKEEVVTEKRKPLEKRRVPLADVDTSGLYPQPKIIESEVSFAFDEDEDVEKTMVKVSETDAEVVKFIMNSMREITKSDPDSIFKTESPALINKIQRALEDSIILIKKGVVTDIPKAINDVLPELKPNLRNTIIRILSEKLSKYEKIVELEEEKEEEEEEEEHEITKTIKKDAQKAKLIDKMPVLQLEKVKDISLPGKPEKIHKTEEKPQTQRIGEESLDLPIAEELKKILTQMQKEETGFPKPEEYEKINWELFLTESEKMIVADPRLRKEMEYFLQKRKKELLQERKDEEEKMEREKRYKSKDSWIILENINLHVTMKFLLNTGEIFTCAYKYFMTFREIKNDLAGIFRVPSDVLIIYRDNVEVKDEENSHDLVPKIEPFDCVTFRLLTVDNDRWRLRSSHVELPTPDIITCTVETGQNYKGVPEYKEVVVEIEQKKIKKPFIGGYRDICTGIEYHHAFSQSDPRQPSLPYEMRVSTDTQTAEYTSKGIETDCDKSTQMSRIDYYVSTENDKIITPQPYVDYETWCKQKDVEGKITVIQRYVRAMIIRKFIKKMSEEYRARKIWEEEEIRKRAVEREIRVKQNIINMVYPKTKADFEALYAMVERWRRAQIERIGKLKTEAPKKAELCAVLEKEIKLLEAIEVHRIAVSKEQKKKKELDFIAKVSKPVSWTGYRGMTIEMDTLKTQRARELRELYLSLTRNDLNYQDRIELLISLKYALRAHCTRLAEDLTTLLNRECEMLIRGVSPQKLEYLRQRIDHLFMKFFKEPDFNPEVAKYDPDYNRESLKQSVMFCKMCHQMKMYKEFGANARDTTCNVCQSCRTTYNIAVPRIDLNPYRFILKCVRKDEQKKNCYSSCAFILQDEDMRFLIENIWHSKSAISENDNLMDLRMPRWDKNKDWTPWNCILLTELEAKSHTRIDPTTNYEKQLQGEIVSKHQLAKRHFQQMFKTEERMRDTGKWANIVDVKKYIPPVITADIWDLTQSECIQLDNKGRLYEVHEWPMGNDTMKSKMEIDPTTQKDAGYYECQADNQYAIDRRGFRTDYVIYTY